MTFAPKGSHPAILEQSDIVVTLATYSKNDYEHGPLPCYEYGGHTYRNQVACWVPVPIVNRRFCVHVAYEGKSLPYPGVGLRAVLFIDGGRPKARTYISPEEIQQRILEIKRKKPRTTGEMEMRGYESNDGTTIRPFYFDLREFTPDENFVPSNIDDFGEVEVVVYWAIQSAPLENEEASDSEEPLEEPVYEGLKQITGHRYKAKLGEAEVDDEPTSQELYDFERVNRKEEFWFSFKYRDIEWLKAEQVIPAEFDLDLETS